MNTIVKTPGSHMGSQAAAADGGGEAMGGKGYKSILLPVKMNEMGEHQVKMTAKKSDRRHLLQSPHFFYFFGSRSTLFSFSLSFCDADLTSCVKKSHQNLQPESRNSRMSTFFPSLSVTPVSLTLVDPGWHPCSRPDTGQHQLQGGYRESLLETLREAVTVLYKCVQQ